MKSPLEQFDTKDDRTEVYLLFDRLTPAKRLMYLRWACRQCTAMKLQPYVKPGHSGTTKECVMDFWGLVHSFGLHAEAALAALEAFVRINGKHIENLPQSPPTV
jgi:hypothetical protein